MERANWHQDRRRKQPSLYDEYLNEGRPFSQKSQPNSQAGSNTIRSVSPEDSEEPEQTSHRSPSPVTDKSTTSSPFPTTRERWKDGGSSVGNSRQTIGRNDFYVSGIDTDPTLSSARTSGRRSTITSQPTSTYTRKSSMSNPSAYPTRMGSAQFPSTISSMPTTPFISNDRLPVSFSQPLLNSRISSVDGVSQHEPSTLMDKDVEETPSPNDKRIVHLKTTLHGKMSGNLWFRRSVESDWLYAYTYIEEVSGCLVYETQVGHKASVPLAADLRSCRLQCRLDTTLSPLLEISSEQPSQSLLYLRFHSQTDLDSWYAALLYWHEAPPRSAGKGTLGETDKRPNELLPASSSRQNSEVSLFKEAPVIKVGQMILWDTDLTYSDSSTLKTTSKLPPQKTKDTSNSWKVFSFRRWRRVSCTLRENGELKLFAEANNVLVTTIQLSHLSRYGVQKLHCSILERELSIVIHPQYASASPEVDQIRPIFLSLDTRVLFEVWFVLLRAFTTPQLYGPRVNDNEQSSKDAANNSITDGSHHDIGGMHDEVFRMQRGLSVSIKEAKISKPFGNEAERVAKDKEKKKGSKAAVYGFYAELHLDRELWAKTEVRTHESRPYFSQEFKFQDAPAILSSATVNVKQCMGDDNKNGKPSMERMLIEEAFGPGTDPHVTNTSTGYNGLSQDVTLGKVHIKLEDLDGKLNYEAWLPIVDSQSQEVGALNIAIKADERVVLMTHHYKDIHNLFHAFGNGLTPQIFNSIPSIPKQLAESFVSIFQVSGKSADWLAALVEEEIDGVGKDSLLEKATSKVRYNARTALVEADKPKMNEREFMVRDMNKNAALEANLLFRGNTLLTKALDTHMRRVGSDYLLSVLGSVIKDINDRDPDCEVDPNKTSSANETARNWARLLTTTGNVWEAIRDSADQLPSELRLIFKHIKACAEDRYGDFLRTVSYSSVSGFLFLRFFCPAVLTPKVFGLLTGDPKPRAQRTFVLIAKSLQTLANMAAFGSKEPWMEPMNSFLTASREDFKKFIEQVCSISSSASAMANKLPSYSTPHAIKSRLPPTSQEGFPSLPYLLDEGREYASFVELWLTASAKSGFKIEEENSTSSLTQLDALCKSLQVRAKDCLARAERGDRPNSDNSFGWEDVLDKMKTRSTTQTLLAPPRLDLDIQPLSPIGSTFLHNTTSDGSSMSMVQSNRNKLVGSESDPVSPFPQDQRVQQEWDTTFATALPGNGVSFDSNPTTIDASTTSSNFIPRSAALSFVEDSPRTGDASGFATSQTQRLPGSERSSPSLYGGGASSSSRREHSNSRPTTRDGIMAAAMSGASLSRPHSALSGRFSIRSAASSIARASENELCRVRSASRERLFGRSSTSNPSSAAVSPRLQPIDRDNFQYPNEPQSASSTSTVTTALPPLSSKSAPVSATNPTFASAAKEKEKSTTAKVKRGVEKLRKTKSDDGGPNSPSSINYRPTSSSSSIPSNTSLSSSPPSSTADKVRGLVSSLTSRAANNSSQNQSSPSTQPTSKPFRSASSSSGSVAGLAAATLSGINASIIAPLNKSESFHMRKASASNNTG